MNSRNREIVIFDFCETLVDFQTADAFVDFAREKLMRQSVIRRNRVVTRLRNTGIIDYIDLLSGHYFSLPKRLKLWQLKGVEELTLTQIAKDYYREIVRNHLFKETIDLLKKNQSEGREIWIISGGYHIYLQSFADEYKIDFLISSDIEMVDGKATGRLKGCDCMNNNKVKLLKSQISKMVSNGQEYRIVASYSDSKSDVPILSIAEAAYVISKKHQKWVEKYGFNEILIK